MNPFASQVLVWSLVGLPVALGLALNHLTRERYSTRTCAKCGHYQWQHGWVPSGCIAQDASYAICGCDGFEPEEEP